MSSKITYSLEELLSLQSKGVIFRDTTLPDKEFWRFNAKLISKLNVGLNRGNQKSHNNLKKKTPYKPLAEENSEEEVPEWLNETDFQVDSTFVGYSSIGSHTYEDFEREKREYHMKNGYYDQLKHDENVKSNPADEDHALREGKTSSSSAEDNQFDKELELKDHLNRQFFDNLLKSNLESKQDISQALPQPTIQARTPETSKFERLFQSNNSLELPSQGPQSNFAPPHSSQTYAPQYERPRNTSAPPSVPPYGAMLPPGLPIGHQQSQRFPGAPLDFNPAGLPPPPPELLKLIQEGKLPPLPGMFPGVTGSNPQIPPQFPALSNFPGAPQHPSMPPPPEFSFPVGAQNLVNLNDPRVNLRNLPRPPPPPGLMQFPQFPHQNDYSHGNRGPST
ncbi:hypothetical protein KL918_002908 [Ogataea parapolymorpha]|uniref:Uncharacterized protein n=1 Tax=Ogataea parapolymorpha (strain ATCC 26012 / BCRC 20466 / JCM 22074 / NRRL Y-7560 / DL-1) TaxID=871575 RepID=W1QGR8_OGAPD|nr:hypothetical protein HPODL_00664 [Ogataea parapolymorpha DL-1]ESX01267.1 hypothetical protein HPODL_00664 [Ogataea parapolymorpha DL-1]KAG7867469.1 hypothetical protein KL918_002908 [Ogataea parapolymorpha]KAG7871855.1 hypothetical protein KL916_003705 [Ogataea parapolymorpha]